MFTGICPTSFSLSPGTPEASLASRDKLKFVGHSLYQVGLLLPHDYDLAAELLGNRAKP